MSATVERTGQTETFVSADGLHSQLNQLAQVALDVVALGPAKPCLNLQSGCAQWDHRCLQLSCMPDGHVGVFMPHAALAMYATIQGTKGPDSLP